MRFLEALTSRLGVFARGFSNDITQHSTAIITLARARRNTFYTSVRCRTGTDRSGPADGLALAACLERAPNP